jgi:acetolactate synthase-1/2/3 large subunit
VFDAARPRPVHIDLPIDLLDQPAPGAASPSPARIPKPMPPPTAIAAAGELLQNARAPVMLVGGGAVWGAEAVRKLAERLDAPVVMTANARGLLPPNHPLAVPYSPSMVATRALINGGDMVLALGTESGPTDYDAYDLSAFSIAPRLVRVDIDPEQLVRSLTPELALCGDVAAAAAALLLVLGPPAGLAGDGLARAAVCRAAAGRELGAAMRADIAMLDRIRTILPDAAFVGDSTRWVYAGNYGFAAPAPRSWFNAATGYGALGFGLPAAIGAAVARPERPVVCLAGDGGLQFSLAELGTAAEIAARIVLLVLNNRGFGEIRTYMRERQIAPPGVDLHRPDLCALAHAYGWRAERLAGPAELPDAVRRAASGEGPALIEIVETER